MQPATKLRFTISGEETETSGMSGGVGQRLIGGLPTVVCKFLFCGKLFFAPPPIVSLVYCRVSATDPLEMSDPDHDRLTVLFAHPMGASQHDAESALFAGCLSRELDADVLYIEWPGLGYTTNSDGELLKSFCCGCSCACALGLQGGCCNTSWDW